MNLLPKSREEFSQKEYWDSFFKKRGNKAFEWYGEYPELSTHLHKYMKQQDNILITGCGNSTLGRDLYDIGYKKITNIDISQVVIRQMLSQNDKERPDLQYIQMDALAMSFENEEFSVVLDKGTLDALMPNNNEETVERVNRYFNEIQRVLKTGGRYICVSLLQDQILKIILDYFPPNCMFRAVRCFEAERKASENGESSMPVFIVICTKFKSQLPRKVLELNLGADDRMQRFENVEDVMEQIASAQQASFVCSGLKRMSISDQNEVSLDLFKHGEETPRYTVYVIDSPPDHKNTQYAAFIVPQGREAEWLFSTPTGRKKLARLTKTNRVMVMTMHRGHDYGDFNQVQVELSETVCTLAPADLVNRKIPFFSLGAGVGKRTTRVEGRSEISGDFVVEDVELDDEKFRRLFYLSSQLVIQSEAKLKTVRGKEIVDLIHLTCHHHIYMSIAARVACGDKKESNLAVIGLGGGGLCSFLHKFLPKAKIVGVDIDSEMLKVAINWFGLAQNERLKTYVIDGIKFLEDAVKSRTKMNAVLFDVDSKDSAIGMSCPPQQFLDENVLDNVAKIIGDSGYFVLNLVLRDENLKPDVLASLTKRFKTLLSYQLQDDLNEIFVCATKERSPKVLKNELGGAAREINQFFTKNKSKCKVDLDEYLTKIKIT